MLNDGQNWAGELGPLQQGDIELLEDAIAALRSASATSLDAEHALHGLTKRVEAAKQEQRQPVVEMLFKIDDHLQSMRHYGHSHLLRNAISIVQDLQAALETAQSGLQWCLQWYQDTYPESVNGSDEEAMEQIARAIAKATGSAAC